MNISLIRKDNTWIPILKFIENYCFFNLIKKINPNDNVISYLFTYDDKEPGYISTFEKYFNVKWKRITVQNYKDFYKNSDCCILSGNIEDDQSFVGNMYLNMEFNKEGIFFSYSLINTKNLDNVPINLYNYLYNISFREQTSCNNLNKEQHEIKFRKYCRQHIDPILLFDYEEIWKKITESDSTDNRYSYFFNDELIFKKENKNKNINLKNLKLLDFLKYLKISSCVYTDNYIVLLLSIIFKSKCYYYKKDNNIFKDLQRTTGIKIDQDNLILINDTFYSKLKELRKESFSYVNNLLNPQKEIYNYNDIKIFKCKRKDTFNKILKEEKNILYINDLNNNQEKTKSDVALISTFYGNEEKRVNSVKLSIDLIYKYSNPLPGDWIFIEAQKDESMCVLKDYCLERGIKHQFVKINDCFSREFYFNYGTKFTNLNKFVFTDCDFVMVESDWLKEISNKLNYYEVIQPFKYFSYCNEVKIKQTFLQNTWWHHSIGWHNYIKNKYKDSKNRTRKYYQYEGFPGISVGMTRKLFNIICGQTPSPSSMGDGLFYKMMLGYEYDSFYLYSSFYSYGNDITRYGKLKQIQGINPVLGYANNLCQHIYHGAEYLRCNKGHMIFSRRTNTYTNEDIKIDNNKIEWNNELGNLHKKCLSEYDSSKYRVDENLIQNYSNKNDLLNVKKLINKHRFYDVNMDSNNIFLDNCIRKYGEIKEDDPLHIVLYRDKTYMTNNDRVRQINLFRKYCKVPFVIHEINSNNLDEFNKHFLISYIKLNAFREFKNKNCLIVSGNVFPIKEFRTFPCRNNCINMPYITCNNKIKPDHTWNSDVIYFNGNYSFIYEDYIRYINNQNYNIMTFNEFLISCCYKYNISIRNLDFYLMCFTSELKKYDDIEKLGDLRMSFHDLYIVCN